MVAGTTRQVGLPGGLLAPRPGSGRQPHPRRSRVRQRSDVPFGRRARRHGALRRGLRARARAVRARSHRGARLQAQRLRAGRRRGCAGRRRRDLARRRASLRGRPHGRQEQPARQGPAPHLRVRADGRLRARLRPQHHTTPARCRLRHRRHDHAARVRHPAHQRGTPLRPDAQPVGPAAHAWRGRRGGGGRGSPGGARQRRRWLGADPRRLLRPGGAQARARSHLARPRAGRLLAWNRRDAHAHRRRHCGHPRCARGL